MLQTMVKALLLTRLSSMPNKNGSYAYRVENADDEQVAELLDEVDGVYDGQDGGKIIYSRNRAGKQDRPTKVPIRVVEQAGTGRNFINLINTNLEAVGEFFETVKLAERFGVSNSAAAAQAFYAISGGVRTAAAAPAAQPKEAKVEDAEDAPVMQNADGTTGEGEAEDGKTE